MGKPYLSPGDDLAPSSWPCPRSSSSCSGCSSPSGSSSPPGTVLWAAFLLPALSLVGAGVAQWQLERFRVRRVQLRIPGLPQGLEGFTVVHLSDLHIGLLTRGAVLDRIAKEATGLKADIAVFTGDPRQHVPGGFPPGASRS